MKRPLVCVLLCACTACKDSEPMESYGGVLDRGQNGERDAESAEGASDAGPDAGGVLRSSSAAGAGGAGSGSHDAGAGSGGAAGASTAEGGAAGQGIPADPCPTPAGESVVVSEYLAPTSAQACDLQPSLASSVSIESEAEFLELFSCPEGAASGIDFDSQHLRLTLIPEAGFIAPTRHHAVQTNGVLQLGFELPRYCGGAFPPTAWVLTLIPAEPEAVEDSVCRPGDCGAGGFPP